MITKLIRKVKIIYEGYNSIPKFPYEENKINNNQLKKINKIIKKEKLDFYFEQNFKKRKNKYLKKIKIINKVFNYKKKLFSLSLNQEKNLRKLNNLGFCKNGTFRLNRTKLQKIIKELEKLNVYKGHVVHASKGKSNLDFSKEKFYSYHPKDLLKINEIQELIFNKQFINFVSNYFKTIPTCGSINCFWQSPSKKGQEQLVQNFHRDEDDDKTITFFMFLTDTSLNNGGHEYIKYTHIPKIFFKNLKKKDKEIFDCKRNNIFEIKNSGYGYKKIYEKLRFYKEQLYGKSGTSFFTNNYGFHRAVPPKKKPRLILWISFSLLNNHAKGKFIPSRIVRNELFKSNFNKYEKYIYRNFINFKNEKN